MKIPAFLLRSLLAWSVCSSLFSAAPLETNLEPAQAVVPQFDEFREQLRTIQRSNEDIQRANEELQRNNEEAAEQRAELVVQNHALSNVLTGLQQTLVTQKEREMELSKQSNALTLKVLGGAAAAVFLVFLFSYWFQLRCLNRVMELSDSFHPSNGPALLENENPSHSKLLSAMKLLEQRLHQLELPGGAALHSNVPFGEGSQAHPSNLLNSGIMETLPSSSVSLLIAKGQILLDTERLQEAANCFQEAIAVDPTNAEVHLKKGIALERMNRLDLALNSYDEALRLNPKRALANVYKARVLASLHRYDEAISVYDSALGRNGGKTETPIFAS